VRLSRDYELFLPVFNTPYELFALASVPDWRKRCRFAACFITELWLHRLPHYLLELLANFDHVFLAVRNPVHELSRIVGRPCTYLPLAADVLRFAPCQGHPARIIDVCNIGRRSHVTHKALLRLAQDPRFFYFYDTVAASGVDMKQTTFQVQNPCEHRLLLASLLKRSRFAFGHRSYVNDSKSSQGCHEISSRVYEGAAAGAVMLGEAPQTEEFRKQFNWPDALIPVAFDCPGIGSLLRELNGQPDRLARVRRDNVYNCSLRHDWVHRLRAVFETLRMPITEKMGAREQRLRALASELAAPAMDVAPSPGADTACLASNG
jgi:hypothetical protein